MRGRRVTCDCPVRLLSWWLSRLSPTVVPAIILAPICPSPRRQPTEGVMSLDRSLKRANSLVRHRNVLTRAERLDKLAEEEKWNENKSVFGLPKVAHRKVTVGGKAD